MRPERNRDKTIVVLIAFVQLEDPSTTLAIFIIVTGIQFMNSNVIDPMLMGHALRLSSFGIIINLAFWAAAWGIPGMFLSVPIMVAIMIICSHIPELRGVAVLLSREGLPDTEHDLLGPRAESTAPSAPALKEHDTTAPRSGGGTCPGR